MLYVADSKRYTGTYSYVSRYLTRASSIASLRRLNYKRVEGKTEKTEKKKEQQKRIFWQVDSIELGQRDLPLEESS